MVILVTGVSGAGKTTIGKLLAARLHWPFHDADDLHSEANKDKMSHGIALTDADRGPWLDRVRDLISTTLTNNSDAIIACSALKQSYRDELVIDPTRVKIVYLKGSRELIAGRLAHRQHHFMSKDLLASQFDTLEEPRDATVVDIDATPEAIVDRIATELHLEFVA